LIVVCYIGIVLINNNTKNCKSKKGNKMSVFHTKEDKDAWYAYHTTDHDGAISGIYTQNACGESRTYAGRSYKVQGNTIAVESSPGSFDVFDMRTGKFINGYYIPEDKHLHAGNSKTFFTEGQNNWENSF
jgi:hypothetical protein